MEEQTRRREALQTLFALFSLSKQGMSINFMIEIFSWRVVLYAVSTFCYACFTLA